MNKSPNNTFKMDAKKYAPFNSALCEKESPSMSHKEFQPKPDSYVRFKWKDQEMEGEFFKDSLSIIDDLETTKGYIRPFDKYLRQSIVDLHMKCHRNDFDDYCRVADLIECDALVTHPNLQRPYLDVVVSDFDFIKESQLTSPQELVSDCRADLLKRQYTLSKALNEPAKLTEELQSEYAKWASQDFIPLRYSRTKLTKFLDSKLVHFIGGILVIAVLVKLLAG